MSALDATHPVDKVSTYLERTSPGLRCPDALAGPEPAAPAQHAASPLRLHVSPCLTPGRLSRAIAPGQRGMHSLWQLRFRLSVLRAGSYGQQGLLGIDSQRRSCERARVMHYEGSSPAGGCTGEVGGGAKGAAGAGGGAPFSRQHLSSLS